jgi:hypothetical protein
MCGEFDRVVQIISQSEVQLNVHQQGMNVTLQPPWTESSLV